MKFGVALGGGGAKGFAHVGVIRALERAGISISCVAGTSIGALVGAVLAADKIDEFEKEAENIRLQDIPRLMSPVWSVSGFFTGRNALETLSELLGVETIEELPIPYCAVATELPSGNTRLLDKGSLRDAIRASISLPAIFTPSVFKDYTLVDGGVTEPVPVEAVRGLGADCVIAIDLFGNSSVVSDESEKSAKELPAPVKTALSYFEAIPERFRLGVFRSEGKEDEPNVRNNLLEIVEQTLAASQKQLTALRLLQNPPDCLIQPAVSHIGVLDFHRSSEAIRRGEEAAADFICELQTKLE